MRMNAIAVYVKLDHLRGQRRQRNFVNDRSATASYADSVTQPDVTERTAQRNIVNEAYSPVDLAR